MHPSADALFPIPLSSYPVPADGSLLSVLAARIEADPLNAVATVLFLLAVLHTFVAARFIEASHQVQHRRDAAAAAAGLPPATERHRRSAALPGRGRSGVRRSGRVLLVAAIVVSRGWETAAHYLNDTVNYTEPMFVVVIMALASTRPILELAEGALHRLARLGGSSRRPRGGSAS